MKYALAFILLVVFGMLLGKAAQAQPNEPPATTAGSIVLIPAGPMPTSTEALPPVYGPPAPEVLLPYRTADGREPYTAEQIAIADAKWKAATRSSWTQFWVGQGLSAADAGITCWALAQRNPDGSRKFREANFVFGKNPSCGRIIAFKAAIGIVQYLLIRDDIRENPTVTAKNMKWIVMIQGVPLVWNIYQIAKR